MTERARLGLWVLPLILVAVAGVALLPSPPVTVAYRAIPDDPEDRFEPRSLFATEEVFHWTFGAEAALGPWTPEEGTELSWADRAAVMVSSAGPPRISRAAGFDAADVDVVEVELAGLRLGKAILEFAHTDEPMSRRRRVVVPATHPFHDKYKTYRFVVSQHPLWQGHIDSLMLRVAVREGVELRVRSVRGIRRRLEPRRIQAALERPWKIRLGDETRNALLSVPGIARELAVEVPAEGHLRFAYGVAPDTSSRCAFRVQVAAPGEPPVTAFRGWSQPGTGEWRIARVRLGRWAGRRVRLLLEAESGGACEPDRGVPAWGHPEVLTPDPGEPPPNVILISADTLRADRLSLYGHERPTTPYLERWAADHAAVFLNSVAAAPWTLPSHVSMFTGLDAHHHGVNHNNDRLAGRDTLADRLRRLGYTTVAVTGGGYLRPEFGLARGFDVFRSWSSRVHQGEELGAGVDRALAWLDELADRPVFLLLHTYETHAPFLSRQPWFDRFSDHRPSDELRAQRRKGGPDLGYEYIYRYTLASREDGSERDLPDELADLPTDLYDSAVAHLDAELERLRRGLARRGLTGRTIVVLTSDHGELLGEHDGLASHAYLWEENLMVPLVVATPDGRGAGRVIEQQVRGVDLLPTLLELVGAPPAEGIDGVSLAGLMDGAPDSAPPPAWSYAASNNQGLSLRLENRLKYLWNDSVWPGYYDRETLLRVPPVPGAAAEQPLGPPFGDGAEADALRRETDALRRRLRRGLGESPPPPGLRLRFQNLGDRPLTGNLWGRPVSRTGMKSIDMPCDCLRSRSKNQAAFEIPPRTTFTVELGRARPSGDDELKMTVNLDGHRERFDLERLESPVAVLAESEGPGDWQRSPLPGPGPGPPTATGIVVWWQGGLPSGGLAPGEVEGEAGDELREQLRALGYLD